MTYLQRAQSLYRTIDEGRIMEALDTYYHDDVVVTEGDGTVRHGKAAQREAIEAWMGDVEEMHGGATEFITSNEDEAVTMVQSFTDVTMCGSRSAFREIAVQEWKGDRIIRERFFYYIPAAAKESPEREVAA